MTCLVAFIYFLFKWFNNKLWVQGEGCRNEDAYDDSMAPYFVYVIDYAIVYVILFFWQ